VAQAEAIIDAGVQSFMHWMQQRDPRGGVVQLIQDLQTQTESWRNAEMARARKRLAKGEDMESVLDNLGRALTQKMLHGALAELRSGDELNRQATVDAVTRLFLRGSLPGQREPAE
jgi:glutamyl-tRNA reductase